MELWLLIIFFKVFIKSLLKSLAHLKCTVCISLRPVGRAERPLGVGGEATKIYQQGNQYSRFTD